MFRSTLCPDTKSLAMHKGVCEGALISQTRDMCKKTELLPGVLVSHSPLGSQGLAKIDDNWLGVSTGLQYHQRALLRVRLVSRSPLSQKCPTARLT